MRPGSPMSWAPELRPNSQQETQESRCQCHHGCRRPRPRPRRYLRTEQCWLRAKDSGAQKTAGRGGGGDGEGGKDLGKWDGEKEGGEEDSVVEKTVEENGRSWEHTETYREDGHGTREAESGVTLPTVTECQGQLETIRS
nr:uncharacterized protein LOC129394457 [Pan paniscus]